MNKPSGARGRQPSWRAVADILAARLRYAAYQCSHPEYDDDCPFCRDTAAWEVYVAKGGTVMQDDPPGEVVSLWDLAKKDL